MVTNDELHYLLYSIPKDVDYTTIIEELDFQDMPPERINKLLDIINHENFFKFHDTLKAAGILCSIGIDKGFEYIKDLILNKKYNNDGRGELSNEDYEYLLYVIKSYLTSQSTFGNEIKARGKIYPCVKEIIRLSKVKKISISRFYWIIDEMKYDEYIPLIKDYLMYIIHDYNNRYWDIYDASTLLLKLDPKFVIELFNRNNLLLSDFKLSISDLPNN